MNICVKFEHFLNALSPIDVIFDWMKTDTNDVQPSNKFLGILWIFVGMVIDTNFEHAVKAFLPSVSTLEGISIDVNDEHNLKAAHPMDFILPQSITLISDWHFSNSISGIRVILVGIVISVNDKQPWKALIPIDSMLSGSTIETKDEQS